MGAAFLGQRRCLAVASISLEQTDGLEPELLALITLLERIAAKQERDLAGEAVQMALERKRQSAG
jgi:hypothetical protein